MSEEASREQKRGVRTLTGTVASNRMDKSIAVLVQRTVRHPLYGKYIVRSTRVLAHDEANECAMGDTVIIQSSRPLSRRKAWCLQRIVKRADRV